MKIHTYEVPQAAIDACNERIMQGNFKAGLITEVAIANGVPELINREYIANRVADRLIQKARKQRKIHMPGKFAVWQIKPETV